MLKHLFFCIKLQILNNLPYLLKYARGAYLIFRATSGALIRGWRLFKNCTRQIYFFHTQFLFNGTLSFYLLIFLWTDTKLI